MPKAYILINTEPDVEEEFIEEVNKLDGIVEVASVYGRYESARGDVGFYIMSNGKNIPMRVKMRSPAFCNLSVLSEIAEGWMISDVIAILGSLDIVLGEIDR